jgi:peptidoglycan/LPS O-acetylase OafA/YrhL
MYPCHLLSFFLFSLLLPGIRVLSMAWVILGHTLYIHKAHVANIDYVELDLPKRLWMQIVLQSTFSVDTFFVLSGFLATFMLLKYLKTRGRINFGLYYFHRHV